MNLLLFYYECLNMEFFSRKKLIRRKFKYLDVTEYKNRNLENDVFLSFFLEKIPIILSPAQSVCKIFEKRIYYCFNMNVFFLN